MFWRNPQNLVLSHIKPGQGKGKLGKDNWIFTFMAYPDVVLTQKCVEGKLEGVDPTHEGEKSCKISHR